MKVRQVLAYTLSVLGILAALNAEAQQAGFYFQWNVGPQPVDPYWQQRQMERQRRAQERAWRREQRHHHDNHYGHVHPPVVVAPPPPVYVPAPPVHVPAPPPVVYAPPPPNQREVRVMLPEPNNEAFYCVVGAGLGATAGGLLGNQIGKGDGKTAATIGGAILGGLLGAKVGCEHGARLDAQRRQRLEQIKARCLDEEEFDFQEDFARGRIRRGEIYYHRQTRVQCREVISEGSYYTGNGWYQFNERNFYCQEDEYTWVATPSNYIYLN